MRILVIGDVHNDILLIKRLVESIKREKPDYLFILGDISDFGEIQRGIIKIILRYIDSNKVFLIPGNHETVDLINFIKERYRINIFHKDAFPYDDTVLVGLGGGDIVFFLISEGEIEEFLREVGKKFKDKRILLFSHLPPSYTRTSLFEFGSRSIYNFIKYVNPELVVHAHIHETGGLEDLLFKTPILNASRSIFLIEVSKDRLNFKRVF